jgi:SpoVK/Ycf46/Vps4 family AAA+-type ATPase
MTTSSRAAIAAYLHGMMRCFAPGSAPGKKLAEWLRQNQQLLGIGFDDLLRMPAPSAGQRIRAPEKELLRPDEWKTLSDALSRSVAAHGGLDPVGGNIAALSGALELDAAATEVFRFVFETARNRAFEWLCSMILGTRAVDSIGLIAAGTGRDPNAVWQSLSSGSLGALQLVKVAVNSGEDFACFVPERIVTALTPPNACIRDVERHLIGRPLAPSLDLAAFDHLATECDFVKRLLGNAVAQGRPGVNILFYGRPGTGKTEFCKTIAAALELDLFGVGEADEWGGEPVRDERLEALQLADRLAERRGRTLLLFDEMQDLLQTEEGDTPRRRRRNTGSKIFMNRLLEQNRVPILWTSNDIGAFDPAFIRRMSYVLEMKPLPLAARARMVAVTARRSGIEIDAARAGALARRYRVAPGIVSGAIASAALAGGGVEAMTFAADALARAAEDRAPAAAATAGSFQAELTNADLDLAAVTRRLASENARRDFSLVLYGPPGTGKSAFARHLAEAIDFEPLYRRASDLLSPWVGVTERKLAETFAEAKADRRFLIIDEAEPFLWSRSSGSRSWEVSMVDEFLVQMENHDLPVACTTNLPDAVDAAALRRFTLKVKFDFMTAGQAARAYAHFFGRAAPPALGEIASLTPSDFAAVVKRCRLLGETASDAALLALLEREVAAKPGVTRKIGFSVGPAGRANR